MRAYCETTGTPLNPVEYHRLVGTEVVDAIYRKIIAGEEVQRPEKPGPIEAALLKVVDLAATIRRDGIEGRGGEWPAAEEEAFKAPIRERYETEGDPYFATARLWDDGIIDPAQTRDVLGLSISASLNAPIPETRFGVFRM